MSLQLDQSNVTLEDPFKPMLINLQANILKSHGRNFAYHLFFTFDTTKANEAIEWIQQSATTTITSAKNQLEETAKFNKGLIINGGTVFTLSLSSSGYDHLGILASQPMSDDAFKLGMKHPDTIAALKDDIANWEDEFGENKSVDMLIIIADSDAKVAQANEQAIIKQTAPFASLIKSQRGNILKMEGTKVGIEHFGYADGISQPMYLDDEINNQSQPRVWDDKTNLDMLLVAEPEGEDRFGSFFVFRKLEQNVKCFKIAEGDSNLDRNLPKCKRLLPEVLPRTNSNPNEPNELPGAMIVGRFENGTPVTMLNHPFDPNPHVPTNDFDYSNDLAGLKCPFHAHIRLVNPRKGNQKQDSNEIRSHRITRRGIPFDDNDIKRIPDEKITEITDEMLEDNQPTGKLGLLFMCYQSSIRNQFEELQGQWANKGEIDPVPLPPNESVGEDSLITQGLDAPRTLPKQWGFSAQSKPFNFSGFVKMRGGEYFYTPSIAFLKNLQADKQLITAN